MDTQIGRGPRRSLGGDGSGVGQVKERGKKMKGAEMTSVYKDVVEQNGFG